MKAAKPPRKPRPHPPANSGPVTVNGVVMRSQDGKPIYAADLAPGHEYTIPAGRPRLTAKWRPTTPTKAQIQRGNNFLAPRRAPT